MHLSNAFLGNHSQVELLVFAEHHESDRVSLLSIILVVNDRLDSRLHVAPCDVLRCHFVPVAVSVAKLVHLEVHGALWTHLVACTLLTGQELIDVFTNQRDESKTVRKELIMKSRCVLFNLHQINCHCGDLRDHNTAQGVGHSQVSLIELKLSGVSRQV